MYMDIIRVIYVTVQLDMNMWTELDIRVQIRPVSLSISTKKHQTQPSV